MTNASDERRARARARLTQPALLKALADLLLLPWEIDASGPQDTPYRIRPGREFRRFMSGSNIRSFDEHAMNLLAEALSSRVQRLHRLTVSFIEAKNRGVSGNGFTMAKEFVIGRIRDALNQDGLPGLLALVQRPLNPASQFGAPRADLQPPSASTGLRMFDPRDRLARGFHGLEIPSERSLLKATAYLRKQGWTIKPGMRTPWVIDPSRSVATMISGAQATSEDKLARSLIARVIQRMIPLSTSAINMRMPTVASVAGMADVRRDLCSTIDATIRRSDYPGLLDLVGVGY